MEQLEDRRLLAADFNAIFDGSFELSFHHYGIVPANPPQIVNQLWQDANPSLFPDPAGPNTGWFLQPIPGLSSGGSVDVVGTLEHFGAGLTQDFFGKPASYAAQDGNDAIDLVGTNWQGAFNQVFETIPGAAYRISFWLSSNQEHPLQLVDGRLIAHSDRQVQLFWDGAFVATLNAPDMGTWQQFTFTQVATGTTAQLGFLGLNTLGSRVPTAGVTPIFNIPHNAGDPLFGPLLDNVSAFPLPNAQDDLTVLSESFSASSFARDVTANDIGVSEIVSAQLIGRTTNSLAPIPAGNVININNPAPGFVFWDLPGGDPMPLVADPLAQGEFIEDLIRYTARSVNTGLTDTAFWRVRVNGENDPVTITSLNVTNTNENGFVNLAGTFSDVDFSDSHTVTINWGDPSSPGNTQTISLSSTSPQAFSASHQYLDDNPSGTPQDNYQITVTVADNHGLSDTRWVNRQCSTCSLRSMPVPT